MNALTKLRQRSLGLCTTLGLCCASVASAADISGTVYDDINDLYLNGGEVTVVETGQSTFTSRGGEYALHGLEPGTYTVRASAVGLPDASQRVTIDDAEQDVDLNLTITTEQVFDCLLYTSPSPRD